MKAFLYSWNPNKWNWIDYADAVYRINNSQTYEMYWSCGNTKKIEKGDIFFLMKLGMNVGVKGIIGWGYIVSSPSNFPHWDDSKRANGDKSLKTEVIFKDLSDEPLISLEELNECYPNFKWTPQGGGNLIPEEIYTKLLLKISDEKTLNIQSETVKDEVTTYLEGKVKRVTINTYDRSTQARQACIEHFGYKCSICEFDFQKAYGVLGESYIEVHHLSPLAEINHDNIINPVEDLRPVCANCHRMLHRKKQVLSIDELKRIIDENRK